jgi:hypothetical protein
METTEFASEVQKNLSGTDFSILPNKAKEELFEFYLFLLSKYSLSKSSDSAEERKEFLRSILPKPVKKFIPLKRDEIYAK